jgi:hypothetical protein
MNMTTEIIIKLKPYLREFILGMLNEDCISSSSKPFVGRLIKIMIDYLPKNFITYTVYDALDKSSYLKTTNINVLEKINTKRIRESMKRNEPLNSVRLLKYKPVNIHDCLPEGYALIDIKRFNLGIDNRGNLFFADDKQRDFENLMDEYFHSIFYQYMDDKMRYTELINGESSFKRCMFDFCADYNINLKFINYEMMKKSYYRHRNCKQKIKIFSRALSLNCPLIFLL